MSAAVQESPNAWDAAWVDALDQLDLDLAAAEQMLAAAHLPPVAAVARAQAWRPPAGIGPLPASLEQRARELLDRQLAVAQRLAEAAAQARRQRVAAEAMRTRSADAPVFLDTQG
ncbi:hypothetical protein [Puerhibacterium puerhi]|uniref:hypothetical protein n=1 Tax=Puerhibacterium puerhi TaxID=2692623 RepID=UPI001357B3A6|nr:hypothetical protein [Puerhibacterium puerhi]